MVVAFDHDLSPRLNREALVFCGWGSLAASALKTPRGVVSRHSGCEGGCANRKRGSCAFQAARVQSATRREPLARIFRASPMTRITQLLERVRAQDAGARDALFAAAYEELRRLARARLRDGGRNTVLETTSLVHECYLRFVGAGELRASDRRAFFAYASQVMRSVILNSVRERQAERRGGGAPHVT